MGNRNITSEKRIERKLSLDVAAAGGWSFKLLSDYTKGLPDRICIFPGGNITFVEVKTTGKSLSASQSLIARKLAELGCDVRKIDTPQGVDQLIDDHTKK
jgi:hypothetical protein